MRLSKGMAGAALLKNTHKNGLTPFLTDMPIKYRLLLGMDYSGPAWHRSGAKECLALLQEMTAKLKHKVIEEDLVAAIESGRLAVGMQIPTVRLISRDYGVSQTTAHKAITTLVGKGFLEGYSFGIGQAPVHPRHRHTHILPSVEMAGIPS